MSRLLRTLADHAQSRPLATALSGARESLSYVRLHERVAAASALLSSHGCRRLAMLADNGVDWAVADLAALAAGIPTVPLPLFFSPSQLIHVLRDSGCDAILTDDPLRVLQTLPDAMPVTIDGAAIGQLGLIRLGWLRHGPDLPAHTAKIIYTSGTTGEPKGVCLSLNALETVAGSLMQACGAHAQDRHLCVLPLAMALENIAGVYVPILAGAATCIMPLERIGWRGMVACDANRLIELMLAQDASSAIVVPQVLKAMLHALAAGVPIPPSLRFLAVGGAPVPASMLSQAQSLGLPVYQGYGLSECASVVALNVPGANKPGSVGRPLPHLEVHLADDGEILVRGPSLFLGYLGGSSWCSTEAFWPTGDIGRLDAEGYLYIIGRKKNIFITAYGRNVSPDWVESELTAQPQIAQAAVFGEGRPGNLAVIVPGPLSGEDAESTVADAIARACAVLPDYAQIRHWLLADEPFTPRNGLATGNGRLRRDAIWNVYGERLMALEEAKQ